MQSDSMIYRPDLSCLWRLNLLNLIHHRGQLKVTFPGYITWKVDKSRRYDSLYWLALFGPFTKRPFAEKRKFHFQHWHPGSETKLRKCPTKNSWKLKKGTLGEPVWRYPTTVLSKTGRVICFLHFSWLQDSLESFVHMHKSSGFHIHPKVSSLEKCWKLQWSSWFFPSTSIVFFQIKKTLCFAAKSQIVSP